MDEARLAEVVRQVVMEKLAEKRCQDALAAAGPGPAPQGGIPRHAYTSTPHAPLVVAANWKMHMDRASALAFAQELRLPEAEGLEVVLCPPFTLLHTLAEALKGTRVLLGAQDVHHEAKGAFTGEVSPLMLVDAGCTHVIVGHSERRRLFGETDEAVALKLAAALGCSLSPILCVGETLAEREAGATTRVVANQLRLALGRVSVNEALRVVVAYEPVWAIGTGRNATPEQAQEVHAHIRGVLAQAFSHAVARDVRVIYGGSVKPDNAAELAERPDVDGFLVGGASLDHAAFGEIVRRALEGAERRRRG